ncbi:Hypothetical predicted protein [Xyrichtys novacula]|uniref:Uncharacterized protein n=1 Tax=Xyrichtys novacula TaxID=13765 RepID=A0AAV1FAI8_XYRNO|nr:Hypothetical predicted protein [Xyrichtys novacula]
MEIEPERMEEIPIPPRIPVNPAEVIHLTVSRIFEDPDEFLESNDLLEDTDATSRPTCAAKDVDIFTSVWSSAQSDISASTFDTLPEESRSLSFISSDVEESKQCLVLNSQVHQKQLSVFQSPTPPAPHPAPVPPHEEGEPGLGPSTGLSMRNVEEEMEEGTDENALSPNSGAVSSGIPEPELKPETSFTVPLTHETLIRAQESDPLAAKCWAAVVESASLQASQQPTTQHSLLDSFKPLLPY